MSLFHMHTLRNSTESTLNLCERKYSSLLVYVKTTMFSQGRNMLLFMMLRHFQSDSFFYCLERPKRNTNIIFIHQRSQAITILYSRNSAFNFEKHQICPVLPDFAHIQNFVRPLHKNTHLQDLEHFHVKMERKIKKNRSVKLRLRRMVSSFFS